MTRVTIKEFHEMPQPEGWTDVHGRLFAKYLDDNHGTYSEVPAFGYAAAGMIYCEELDVLRAAVAHAMPSSVKPVLGDGEYEWLATLCTREGVRRIVRVKADSWLEAAWNAKPGEGEEVETLRSLSMFTDAGQDRESYSDDQDRESYSDVDA